MEQGPLVEGRVFEENQNPTIPWDSTGLVLFGESLLAFPTTEGPVYQGNDNPEPLV